MVRKKQFRTRTGKDGSARYFTDHLSASDYYKNRGGILQGKTFEHLGMSKREVDLKVFSALESNLHPETGERITLRTNNTRREWWKNPQTGQEESRLVDNHRPGMELAESLALVRVRKGGAQKDRPTGNLLYLSVIHRDARPVGSNVPDPYWHSHNFIFNMTWDPVEKCLKAVQLHDVVKHADTIDAYFLSELERGLSELGIGTERTPNGRSFEVTGVKGKEIFSKRRNEILKAEFQERDRIEILVKREIQNARLQGKTLDYDKVKAEVRNRLGKALA